ncbi:hypothetical protein IEQ34_008840 [Dendrobium chrysotoxum]|uniref:Uncharacterized protein n=1 Tax=Dendrobium chrysotoxum TaxID=161865 RepID=A0AAV7GHK5_DENCH|nr:hypothetical protein IEQ34_008840 [Dendrobium chrysotoxum]
MIQEFNLTMKLKEKIVKLAGLEEDECLQLLDSHAFASIKKPPGDHNFSFKSHCWRSVLESNLLGQNSINSILRLSYIVLPKYLQNCFAFCCMFPQDQEFGEGDLVLTYSKDDQNLVDILRSICML